MSEEVKLIDKYDYLIVNDEIDLAVKKINMIVSAENLRPSRNVDFIKKCQTNKVHIKLTRTVKD